MFGFFSIIRNSFKLLPVGNLRFCSHARTKEVDTPRAVAKSVCFNFVNLRISFTQAL